MAENSSPQDGNNSGKFSCLLCDAGGFTQAEMEHHVQMEHSVTAEQPYSCLFCLYTTTSMSDLHCHIRQLHPDQFICLDCFVTFATEEEMNKHATDIHGQDSGNNVDARGAEMEVVRIKTDADDKEPRKSVTSSVGDNSPELPMDTDDHLNVTGKELGDGVNLSNSSLRLNDCPSDCDGFGDYYEGDDNDVLHDEDTIETKEKCECPEEDDEQSNLREILNQSLVEKAVRARENNNAQPSQGNNNTVVTAQDNNNTAPAHGGAKPKTFSVKTVEDSVTKSQAPDFSAKDVEGNGASVNDTVDIFNCPFCLFATSSVGEIQRHVDEEHMMEDGEEEGELTRDMLMQYMCPFCAGGFDTPNDLSRHINTEHPDGEIGGGSSSTDNMSSFRKGKSSQGRGAEARVDGYRLSIEQAELGECPVCAETFDDNGKLQLHVESHFASTTTVAARTERDRQMALRLQQEEKRSQETDNKQLQQLQAEFGMDNTMTAKQQFDRDLERAVSSGKLTSGEFQMKKVTQSQAIRSGVDDGSTLVPGILEKLRSFYDSRACPRNVAEVHFANSTHHYSGSYGDKGWGCGYRNFQMLLSCLMNDPTYLRILFNGQAKMPSIQKLQQLLEMAWQKGFDPQGREQLGGSVVNTRKWIGATEILATLSSLRIKCMLLDFTEPTGPDSTHPTMIQWVRDYFTSSAAFKPSLYLQHQGHSRTIVGVECLRNGDTNLLLFDPGVPRDRMQQFHGNIHFKALQTVRKTIFAFRAKQYQIVAVVGVLNDREYEASKMIRSTRMS